ncbi:MAG: hypothetical protein ABSF33_09570 [Acidimicrobiales bacterium]|jgi:hypothetical protein
MSAPSTQFEQFGPWPVSIAGRQRARVVRQHGWRRMVAVAAIGGEALLVIIVVLFLI